MKEVEIEEEEGDEGKGDLGSRLELSKPGRIFSRIRILDLQGFARWRII